MQHVPNVDFSSLRIVTQHGLHAMLVNNGLTCPARKEKIERNYPAVFTVKTLIVSNICVNIVL